MAKRLRVSIINSVVPASPRLPSQGVEVMTRFWSEKLAQVLPDQPDLILLPEFCDLFAGCAPEFNAQYSLERGARMLKFFQKVAREHRCYLAYPTLWECDDASRRNVMLLLDRDGAIAGRYEKNHVTIA